MDGVLNEYWEPLPPEVADWMGASDAREPLADRAEPLEVPVPRDVGVMAAVLAHVRQRRRVVD